MDKKVIRAEIVRRLEKMWAERKPEGFNPVELARAEVLEELKSFIDSLDKEPVYFQHFDPDC